MRQPPECLDKVMRRLEKAHSNLEFTKPDQALGLSIAIQIVRGVSEEELIKL